ncbi:MAG TPA: hypothetical protein DIW34_04105 [Oribacterium sp.]|nr:hypothetical protein [Oribacterium sp.]
MKKNMNHMNPGKHDRVKGLLLSGLLLVLMATTVYAGVKSRGVTPITGEDTSGPSVPSDGAVAIDPNQTIMNPNAAYEEGYTRPTPSPLQIDYKDTEEAGGIMTLESANHWARFDFYESPSDGEAWTYTMDNPILEVENSFTPKDPSDTLNVAEGIRRFTLRPTDLGTVTVTFNCGKAGEEPYDTMIYTFVVDEDLRITLVNATNPNGDKSRMVRPVVK